jgi:hypothetical protein
MKNKKEEEKKEERKMISEDDLLPKQTSPRALTARLLFTYLPTYLETSTFTHSRFFTTTTHLARNTLDTKPGLGKPPHIA